MQSVTNLTSNNPPEENIKQKYVSIQLTAYDNEVSLMYKWAISYSIPTRYLIVQSSNDHNMLDIKFDSLFITIQNAIESNLSLIEIYNQLNTIRDRILDTQLEQDLPYVYFYIKSTLIGDNVNIEQLDDIVNDIVDYYSQLHITSAVDNFSNWRPLYQHWYNEYQELYSKDLQLYQYINDIHKTLEEFAPLPYSGLTIEQAVIEIKPTTEDNQKIAVGDGIDLFDYATLSNHVPYLQYNAEERNNDISRYFKVFTGQDFIGTKEYDLIIPSLIKTSRPQTIYITIFNGSDNIRKITSDNYSHVMYYLDNNQLQVTIPLILPNSRELVVADIQKTLHINVSNLREVKVSGHFYIYGVEIIDVSFLDMILNEAVFNAYLYINEVKKPVSEKKRLRYRFKSLLSNTITKIGKPLDEGRRIPSSVTFSLYQQYIGNDETINVQTANGQIDQNFPAGTPYIKVNIIEARSREELTQFINIFVRLMNFYHLNQSGIENIYKNYFPDVEFKSPTGKSSNIKSGIAHQSTTPGLTGLAGKEEEDNTPKISKSRGRKGSRIAHLQSIAPDLFSAGYARICQGTISNMRQPVILTSDEANAWRQQTFTYGGEIKNKQILEFPYKGSNLLIACPEENNPFPGLQINNKATKEEYSQVPCCFGTDRTTKIIQAVTNRGRKPKTITSSTYIIKTDKALEPNRLGYAQKDITYLLERYRDVNSNMEIVRYGVIRSASSLIHCLFQALNDRQYLTLSDDDKENYVIAFRSNLPNFVNLGLLKQELYDYSDTDIGNQLQDNNLFFDSKLFYRSLEVMFNINIFTFTTKNSSQFNTNYQFQDDSTILETPRAKFFHIRKHRPELYSIVVYKNWGSEKDNFTYPQYELLVDANKTDKSIIKVFAPSMTKLLYSLVSETQAIYSWHIDNSNQVIGNKNFFSMIDYLDILTKSNITPTAQLLDNYGKLRGFNFPIEIETDNGIKTETMTMIIPPAQPENLPLGTIELINTEFSLSIFGIDKLSQIAVLNNKIIGLWYKLLNDPNGIFVPTVPSAMTDQLSDKPHGPPNPLIGIGGKEHIFRLNKLHRDLNIILQLITWAYLVAKIPVGQFFSQYLVSGEEKRDSVNIYDFSQLKRKLPKVDNINEVIVYLTTYVPTLIKNNRIYLYSSKLSKGIMYFLLQFIKNNDGLDIPIATEISNYYLSEVDFQHQNNVLIFTNANNFRVWLNIMKLSQFDVNLIRTNLFLNYVMEIEPFFYRAPTGRLYLIQNVLNGEKDRALSVAISWQKNKINLGYRAEIQTEKTAYFLYGISNANNIVLKEQTSETDAVELLTYGSEQFSAMLPLGTLD